MGVNGVDVQFSTAAYKKFPYDIECKNTERMTTLYNYYEQAISHETGGEPLLIVKMNHKKPLAIMDAEHFIKAGFEIEIYHHPSDKVSEDDLVFYTLLTRGMAFQATQDMEAVLDMGRESFGDDEVTTTQH